MSAARKEFQKKLQERLKRAVRLLEMNAPEQVVSKEIVLILCAAIAYCGPALFDPLGKWLVAAARRGFGRCERCDNPIDMSHTEALCEKCLREEEEMNGSEEGNGEI